MKIKLKNIILDVDVKKTVDYYKIIKLPTEYCSCDDCRNFVAGVNKLNHDVFIFFSKLGVYILKPIETVAWHSENDSLSVCYNGFYHICGRMLTDTDCWSHKKNKSDTPFSLKDIYSVSDNFSVGFTNEISLKEEDFTEHVIQMEVFIHNFPWV